MKYDLAEAAALLQTINISNSQASDDTHRKMTIRITGKQEQFFKSIQLAMLPGASMSDAIALGLEVVRQSTLNKNTLYHAKQYCLYSVLAQHNINPHEVNSLLTLLGLSTQPMLDLGNKTRFIANLTAEEKQCLVSFFNLNRTFLTEPTTTPYTIRELIFTKDTEYLECSEYMHLQPKETLLFVYHPEMDIDEYIIVKQTEYAFNLTKTIEVFKPIGRLMMSSEDCKTLKDEFINKAKTLNMRIFSVCVDERIMLNIRHGQFFTSPGQKLQGVAKPI